MSNLSKTRSDDSQDAAAADAEAQWRQHLKRSVTEERAPVTA